MKKYIRNGNLFVAGAFLMMIILFISSSQTYEQQSQIGLLEKLLAGEPFKTHLTQVSFEYAGSQVSIEKLGYFKFAEFFLRKGAHFLTYFLLSGCWFLGLQPRIKSSLLTGVVAWQAASGYAGLDEFHQMLTGGRTPLFQDVALDSAGALTAVVLCLLFSGFKRIRK